MRAEEQERACDALGVPPKPRISLGTSAPSAAVSTGALPIPAPPLRAIALIVPGVYLTATRTLELKPAKREQRKIT